MSALIDRLGGAAGLHQIITDAYARVLDEPDLRPFFQNVDVEKIRRMQHAFLSVALSDDGSGEDEIESNISIRHAHHGLNITRHHFSLFVNCFLSALESAGSVDNDDIDHIIGRLNTYADDVLGTTGVDG